MAASWTGRSKRSRKWSSSIPQNRYALVNLQKLHEEQQQWAEAARVRAQIADIDGQKHGDEPADPRVPAQPDRHASRRAAATWPPPPGRFGEAIDIDAKTAPAYLNLGDVRSSAETSPGAIAAWERLVQTRPRARLPGVSSGSSAHTGARRAAAVRRAVPAADRAESAGLARAAGPVAPLRRGRPSREAFDLLLDGASPQPARPGHPPGDLAGAARRWSSIPELVQRYVDADARRRVLPGSARLHALPLPQHRAALAVPAVPRVEHVRRGAHCAGQGTQPVAGQ